jgi:hypothetical protein
MIKDFKFFRKLFNPEDYDIEPNFRFLGVTPIDSRNRRTMIYVHTPDGTIVQASLITRDHDAYHYADVYDVRGNQVFLLPRHEAEYINVTLTFTPNDNL